MKRLFSTIAAGAAAVGLLAPGAQAQLFKGKTIEVIVPAGAGGGLTRNAQAYFKNFPKYLPGNPKVVIKNVVGGGGQRGINQVYKTGKKDGTQLLWGPLNLTGIAIGLPGIEYVPGNFKIAGTAGGLTFVTIVRKDIKGGIQSREDIVTKSGFNTGGRIPGGNLGLFSRMPFAMLGLQNKFIIGYRNQPRLKAGLLQNEIQAITTGNPGYFAFYLNDTLKKGDGVALFYHPSFDADKGEFRTFNHIKGVPSFIDFYRKVKGGEPSGAAWDAYKWKATFMAYPFWMVMHPDTPDNIHQAISKAWVDNWKDPGSLALFLKGNKAPPVVLNSAQATRIAKTFQTTMPDSAKQWLRAEFGLAKKAKRAKAPPKKK